MTDNELLQLSAKAAGVEFYIGIDGLSYKEGSITHWNPLTADGEALRLAVKLQMVIGIYPTKTNVTADGVFLEEFHGNNSSSATRRAIVRAAAEIGKGMK